MSMLSNLITCNKINIYAGTNASFMIILDELKEINDTLTTIPNRIFLKSLQTIIERCKFKTLQSI